MLFTKLAIGSAKFSIEYINFSVPIEEEQIGPFYPSDIPIHILKIRPGPELNLDPFSISA
jgi:hypothetical protein